MYIYRNPKLRKAQNDNINSIILKEPDNNKIKNKNCGLKNFAFIKCF